MRPDPQHDSPRATLAFELEFTIQHLQELRELHQAALDDPDHDARLSDALAELAGVARQLLPGLDLEPEVQRIPEQWGDRRLRFAGVEGVSLLRRRVIEGERGGLHAVTPRRVGFVVMLDDGGVGWQPPELGPLRDPPSPAVSTDELTGFIDRAHLLVAFLEAEAERRRHV
jgi:hypothetical protein